MQNNDYLCSVKEFAVIAARREQQGIPEIKNNYGYEKRNYNRSIGSDRIAADAC